MTIQHCVNEHMRFEAEYLENTIEIEARFQRTTNRKWPMVKLRIEWSRDR